MRHRFTTVFAAALFAVAALTAPAAASPEGDPSACPDFAVCFWPEPFFNGQMEVVHDPARGTCLSPTTEFLSVANHSGRLLHLFSEAACEGSSHTETIFPGEEETFVQWQSAMMF